MLVMSSNSCISMCIHIYIHTHTHTHTHIHSQTYTCIHTHTNIYIYIYLRGLWFLLAQWVDGGPSIAVLLNSA